MARQIFYAESLARATFTGSTTFQQKMTLTFTPKASKNYAILWGCEIDCSTGGTVQARLSDVTGAVSYASMGRAFGSADRRMIGGVQFFASGGSPPSQQFAVDYNTANGANTVGIQDAWITAIELTSADAWVDTATELSTTSATYTDAASLAFTPGTSGDYLVIASSQINQSVVSKQDARLYDGASLTEALVIQCINNTAYLPFLALAKKTYAASAQNIRIQTRSTDGTTTCKSRRNSIVALRLDDSFSKSDYAESRGASATTSSTFQDKVTLSSDFSRVPTLTLAAGVLYNGAGSSKEMQGRLTDGGVLVGNSAAIGTVQTLSTSTWMRGVVATPSASSTWKTQWASTDNASSISASENAIAALSVDYVAVSAAATLAPLTSAATAAQTFAATSAATFAPLTSAAVAAQTFIATSAATLAPMTTAASADQGAGASGTILWPQRISVAIGFGL